MSKFHTLKVVDIVRETADAVSVALQVPDELKEDYKYKQGQYLTFKLPVNGEELRRSYSICSSPVEGSELRVAIKKVKDGRMSSFMNDKVKVGDMMEVMVPMGNFYTEMNASNKKNYVLFAGGSGITPMLSILKTVLKSEPSSCITLFYGNNDEASVIFKKQIDALADQNSSRLKVYHVLNSASLFYPRLLKGLMTKDKCVDLIKAHTEKSADNEYFVCGPGPMMANVKDALVSLKINEEKIHIEYFTSAADLQEIKAAVAAAPEPSVHGVKATITLEKQTKEVILKDKETILEAAMRIGMDPPFACQGGSCCTCRALLEQGEVKMDCQFRKLKKDIYLPAKAGQQHQLLLLITIKVKIATNKNATVKSGVFV
jgi:ring-1,2-phenylacetyl-CoA epoxidase subunit PaaE